VEISEFYAARLDEDEAAARANVGDSGLGDTEAFGPSWPDYQTYSGSSVETAQAYLDRFRPLRTLREVEAGRRILARYADCLARMEDPGYPAGVARDQVREYEDFVLPNLVAEFSGHPDYQEGWEP
jgi:hypothetical protein